MQTWYRINTVHIFMTIDRKWRTRTAEAIKLSRLKTLYIQISMCDTYTCVSTGVTHWPLKHDEIICCCIFNLILWINILGTSCETYHKWLTHKSGFPCTLENSGKWPFHVKSGKSQGISQAPQGILENSKISGNSQGILAMADFSATSKNVTYFFCILCPQFSNLHYIGTHIFVFKIQKNNTSCSFKITCGAHCIVKLALQSERVLAWQFDVTSLSVSWLYDNIVYTGVHCFF